MVKCVPTSPRPHVPESPRPTSLSPRVPESPRPHVPESPRPRVPTSPRPRVPTSQVPCPRPTFSHSPCAPGININRVARNKNLTYFAFGFSVISLTISELMLEIHLESMQQTELHLKCFIITGGRLKVSPIVSRKIQLRSDHVTQHTCEFKTELMKLDIMVDKMKLFDYKNPKQLTLKFQELDHFSNVRNGNVQFPCEIRRSHVFPGVRNLHKHRFFSASNWTHCSIFCASKRKTSASEDAMTHSGYISAEYCFLTIA